MAIPVVDITLLALEKLPPAYRLPALRLSTAYGLAADANGIDRMGGEEVFVENTVALDDGCGTLFVLAACANQKRVCLLA
jgi:hypothetical protein